MIKVAVFVEGQTELIFVRDMLTKIFGWEKISFSCYSLQTDGNKNEVPFQHESLTAEAYFEILNANGDGRLLSMIKRREAKMFENGFQRIIGLRDMFCEEYRKHSDKREHSDTIFEDINQMFINGAYESVQLMSSPNKIGFHFSIMEIEAWLLAIHDVFPKINKQLTHEKLSELLGFEYINTDVEKAVFHPAEYIAKIMEHIGLSYKKDEHDVSRIISHIEKEDFEKLDSSSYCNSFTNFFSEFKSIANQLDT